MNDSTTLASDQAKALVGSHFRLADHFEVGREKIREFARAVQDRHPAHRREDAAAELGYKGIIAPLTFPSIVWMLMQRALFDSVLTGYDISQMLQTEQRIRMHRPLVAGDVLGCDAWFESFRQFGDKDFLVSRNVLTDADGHVLQTAHSTVVAQTGPARVGGFADAVDGVIMTGTSLAARTGAEEAAAEPGIAAVTGEPAAVPGVDEWAVRIPRTRPAFEELRVGDELPARSFPLSRGDLVNYAGVSGDTNPIHFSDEIAAAVGLPDVVAHGLLTMGLGAGYLTGWLGDPAAVVEYGVRFSGFAPVAAARAASVRFTGRVRALDPVRRSATLSIGATCGGSKLFGKASAEVLLR
ncbi:fused (3R)-hydroxyacyl-ACP dehydratase subunits HadA/HadB [Nocardia jiangsuensis]|uniref:Fused (3R)-hydroxyacyl-ACP dehydratase subunits HadA/HadB n=1 Tax=Nocardia jiangsuensis TaxID=1691563 RepID=A0ABV8DXY3_9NOCA